MDKIYVLFSNYDGNTRNIMASDCFEKLVQLKEKFKECYEFYDTYNAAVKAHEKAWLKENPKPVFPGNLDLNGFLAESNILQEKCNAIKRRKILKILFIGLLFINKR